MFNSTLTALTAVAILAGSTIAATAADYTLRATSNSNEHDKDYDGLIVFKNFVESASNGAVEVETFMGTKLCGNGAECLQSVSDGTLDI